MLHLFCLFLNNHLSNLNYDSSSRSAGLLLVGLICHVEALLHPSPWSMSMVNVVFAAVAVVIVAVVAHRVDVCSFTIGKRVQIDDL